MRFLLAPFVAAVVLGATPTAAKAGDLQPDTPPQASPPPQPPAGPPWLGVSMDKGGDTGVRIEHVIRNSPAEKGGVRTGDRIVALDGARVTTPLDVTRGVASHKVGDTVTLSIERTGNAVSTPIVLGSRPNGDDMVRMDLVGANAPSWTKVQPLSGAPAKVEDLKGKVVILDFWASWCVPCRMVAPRLGALKDRLGPQGLSVVGITTDDAAMAAEYASKHQLHYPTVVDQEGETSRSYSISGLPTMIVIDKKGVVRDVLVGFDTTVEARLEATVKRLLAEKS